MCSLADRAVCAQHLVASWLVDVFAALSVVLAIVIYHHTHLGLRTPLRLSEVICELGSYFAHMAKLSQSDLTLHHCRSMRSLQL